VSELIFSFVSSPFPLLKDAKLTFMLSRRAKMMSAHLEPLVYSVELAGAVRAT
jgi:hypothetical protein